MKPVDMKRFAHRCEKCKGFDKRGDCASAVIASLVEVPLEEVPFFVEAGFAWWQWIEEWLEARGFTIRHEKRENLPPGPVWASGMSPRGFSHAVVWEGGPSGRVVHDPHPSRAGLVNDPTSFAVIERAPACDACGRSRVDGKPYER